MSRTTAARPRPDHLRAGERAANEEVPRVAAASGDAVSHTQSTSNLPGILGLSVLDAALEYAANGLRVVPITDPVPGGCSCSKCGCTKGGKHPRITGWQRRASSSPRRIAGWWRSWPRSNVGLLTGQIYPGTDQALIVLDLDGRDGRNSLALLEAAFGPLPPTITARTGSGGTHMYFLVPRDLHIHNRERVFPGVDVRGEGGVAVAPPSLHSCGSRYEWLDVDVDDPAPAPAWLVEHVLIPTAPTVTEHVSSPPRAVAGRAPEQPIDLITSEPADGWDRDAWLLWSCLPAHGESRHRAGLRWALSMRAAGADEEDALRMVEAFCGFTGQLVPSDHEFTTAELEEIVRDVYAVVSLLTFLQAVGVTQPWPAKKHAVYEALLTAAWRRCSPSFVLSMRTLADRAGCSEKTAHKWGHSLAEDGWVALDATQDGTRWGLLVPEAHRESAPHPTNPPYHCVTAMSADAFAAGALASCWATFAFLLSCRKPVGVADIARETTRPVSTVRRHLNALCDAGLASSVGGAWVPVEGWEGELDRVAERFGTAGIGRRRRERHCNERERWQTHGRRSDRTP